MFCVWQSAPCWAPHACEGEPGQVLRMSALPPCGRGTERQHTRMTHCRPRKRRWQPALLPGAGTSKARKRAPGSAASCLRCCGLHRLSCCQLDTQLQDYTLAPARDTLKAQSWVPGVLLCKRATPPPPFHPCALTEVYTDNN